MPISMPFASARSRARVIRMATDAGLSADDARAFADRHATVDQARAALEQRAATARAQAARQGRVDAVMGLPQIGEIDAAEARRIAETAPTAEAARSAAADMICDARAREVEYGVPGTPAAHTDEVPNMSVAGSGATVGHSWDAGDGFIAKAADGLAARMSPAHKPTMGREFAHMRLDDIAMTCLRNSGRRIDLPGSRAKAVEMALGGMHTTGDFAGILAGAAQTVVSQGYQLAIPEITQASRMLSAPDYRARTMYRLSSGAELTKVNEHGEIEGSTISEEGEPAPNIEQYGRIFNLSIQAIQNDDVSAFAEISRKMAEGAILTVRRVLVGILEANSGSGVTMRDGNPLFDAAHGNLADTPGQLSLTSLGNAVVAMRRQTGMQGEVLAIRPRFLLVPPEAEQSARQLIADIQPDQAANVNPWADVFDVLVEPGLSDPNRWYVVGDPASADGLAHAYLDGQEGPRVDQKEGWETVGISFRVQMAFGASAIDWRSLYANDGTT